MKRFSLAIAAAMLSLAIAPILHAQRGPSTPEERAKAVKLIHHLEVDPFANDANDARRWLMGWVTQITDIRFTMCPHVMKPILAIRAEEGADILISQFLFASIGYIIEHPDSAASLAAASNGGVEGMLRLYQRIVEMKVIGRNDALETMVAQQQRGELARIVAEQVAGCSSE